MPKDSLSSYYQTSEEYLARISTHPDSHYQEYVSFIEAHLPKGARFLDLGCGSGCSSVLLSRNYDIVGLDISHLFLEKGKEALESLHFVQGSIDKLPFPDNTFDAVGSYNVIEHIPDINGAVAEMVRVTKPDGLIFVCAPNLLSPKYPLDAFKRGGMTYEGKKSKIGLILMFARNVSFLALKKVGILAECQRRTPILSADFADMDAAWHCNPIDIAKTFTKHRAHIQGYQGMGHISEKASSARILNKMVPSAGGLVRIVAKKEQN